MAFKVPARQHWYALPTTFIVLHDQHLNREGVHARTIQYLSFAAETR